MWQICRQLFVVAVMSISIAGCATRAPNSDSGEASTVAPKVQQEFASAVAALAAGDDVTAIRQFESFIEQNPNYSAAYVNLAIVYERQKQPEQALWLLNKAVEMDPAAVEALNRLGVISRRQGNLDAAEAYWRQATTVDPSYPNSWYNLGVLCELYKQDLPAALENYRRYQALTDNAEGDATVAGWIADLERRTNVPVQAANKSEAL